MSVAVRNLRVALALAKVALTIEDGDDAPKRSQQDCDALLDGLDNDDLRQVIWLLVAQWHVVRDSEDAAASIQRFIDLIARLEVEGGESQ